MPGDIDLFQALIATPSLPELGPGPRAGVLAEVELNVKLDAFFATRRWASDRQPSFRAAALLWHDHLDASHEISQGLAGATGSFLHGIMHRREPDYGNAKYWFQRVGQHRAFPNLARSAAELLSRQDTTPACKAAILPGGRWDALAFIDFCEECSAQAETHRSYILAQELQFLEFQALLQFL